MPFIRSHEPESRKLIPCNTLKGLSAYGILSLISYQHTFCFYFLNSEITWASYQVLGIIANTGI
jgi:hypothetical protein